MTPLAAKRIATAGRNVRTADAKRIFGEVRPKIDAEVRAFLSAARDWFDSCGGRWTADGLRACGGMDKATAAANLLGVRLGEIGTAAVEESRYRGARQALRSVRASRRMAGLRESENCTFDPKSPKLSESDTHEVTSHRCISQSDATRQFHADLRTALAQGITIVAPPALLPGEPPDPEPSTDRRNAARVIVRELDGRVWLHDPQNEPYVMIPGGGREDGETMQQAAIRECMEETGLLVELTDYVADMVDAYGWRRFYVGRRIGGEPTTVDGDDGSPVRVRLVTRDEALDLLTSELDKCALMLATKRMQEAESYFATCERVPAGSNEGTPGACVGNGSDSDTNASLYVGVKTKADWPNATKESMARISGAAIKPNEDGSLHIVLERGAVYVDRSPLTFVVKATLAEAELPAIHYDGIREIQFKDLQEMGQGRGDVGGFYSVESQSITLAANTPSNRATGGNTNVSVYGGATILHEIGHHVHLAKLTDSAAAEWSTYSRKGQSARISEYAKTNTGEHFAEAYRAYARGGNRRTMLKNLEPAAYKYMAKLWRDPKMFNGRGYHGTEDWKQRYE